MQFNLYVCPLQHIKISSEQMCLDFLLQCFKLGDSKMHRFCNSTIPGEGKVTPTFVRTPNCKCNAILFAYIIRRDINLYDSSNICNILKHIWPGSNVFYIKNYLSSVITSLYGNQAFDNTRPTP